LGVIATTEAAHHHQAIAEIDDDMLLDLEEPTKPACEYLDETPAELAYQVDMFSRTLDTRHWTNVVNISTAI
jgi:hypothetical protein